MPLALATTDLRSLPLAAPLVARFSGGVVGMASALLAGQRRTRTDQLKAQAS
jgi:hypothetical protein